MFRCCLCQWWVATWATWRLSETSSDLKSGYIGYFCLAAGLGIGSGREVSDPLTLIQLLDPTHLDLKRW